MPAIHQINKGCVLDPDAPFPDFYYMSWKALLFDHQAPATGMAPIRPPPKLNNVSVGIPSHA
jgi:hypothetical protein